MLADIDKNTVDFVDNYDGTQKEPTVLPARLPNLLVNGSSGIAVGMATNIPLSVIWAKVCDARGRGSRTRAHLGRFCKYVTGPDFPTGGTIFRYETRRNPITGESETASTRSGRCTPTAAAGSSFGRRWHSRRLATAAWRSSSPELPTW